MNRSRYILALVLVALTGYISLSYEILWIRLYSFLSGSRAWAFGALLGSYLMGLAFGSLWSLRYQGDGQGDRELKALAVFVLAANVIGFALVPTVSWLVVSIDWLYTLPLVVLAAALLGAALPLICHFSIPADENAGARLSYLYLVNIIGSGLGSLFTGFWLMDTMTMAEISILLSILGIAMALGVAYLSGVRGKQMTAWSGGGILAIALALTLGPTLFSGLYERLQFQKDYTPDTEFAVVVESRFGVITIDEDNYIYGGGIYDGYLGTELSPESWMVRPYFLSAVVEQPKDILMIGLSGGTWAQIISSHPQVEHVSAVEINAAYHERVIPQVESTKSILNNSKVNIIVDDGRRWLRRHPERKFDAVIVNTTFHWREHASSLLSQEFMELIKAHLKPGGIFQFNTTGSDRAALTAATVFEDAYLFVNNVIASNDEITFDRERWAQVLRAYQIDGHPVFTPDRYAEIDEIVSMLDHIGVRDIEQHRRLLTKAQILSDSRGLSVITDDNLGHEFD